MIMKLPYIIFTEKSLWTYTITQSLFIERWQIKHCIRFQIRSICCDVLCISRTMWNTMGVSINAQHGSELESHWRLNNLLKVGRTQYSAIGYYAKYLKNKKKLQQDSKCPKLVSTKVGWLRCGKYLAVQIW